MRSRVRYVFVMASLVGLATKIVGCSRFRSSGADGGTSGGGFFANTLANLVGFEGEIDMTVGMPAAGASFKMTTTLKLKGTKMRVDTPGVGGIGGMAMIYDGEAKKTYTLIPTTHEYTETDLSKLPSSPPSTAPKTVAKKTGTTDRIAGYECENWVETTPGSPNVTELCVAHGMSFYAMGFGPFASFGSGDAFGGALAGGGFPLRMRVLDAAGKETMRMEATRIEKKSEPESDFNIPPGYKKSGGSAGIGAGLGGGGGSGGTP